MIDGLPLIVAPWNNIGRGFDAVEAGNREGSIGVTGVTAKLLGAAREVGGPTEGVAWAKGTAGNGGCPRAGVAVGPPGSAARVRGAGGAPSAAGGGARLPTKLASGF